MSQEPAVDSTAVEDPEPEAPPVVATSHELVPSAQSVPALFVEDVADPGARFDVAARYATAAKDVITRQKLAVRIGNKDHVEIGGWQVLGTMAGVAVDVVDWGPMANRVTGEPILTEYEVYVKAQRTYTVKGRDWWAKAEARLPSGVVIGSAIGIVTRGEDKWAKDDDTALLAMAQTRASSRAYRSALGWVMHLAGYSVTPAEDMPGGGTRSPSPSASDPERPLGPAVANGDAGKASRALTYLLDGDETAAERSWQGIHDEAGYMPAAVAGAIRTVANALREARKAHKLEHQEAASEDEAQEAPSEPAEPPPPTMTPGEQPAIAAGRAEKPRPSPGTIPDTTTARAQWCTCEDPTFALDDSCPIKSHGIPWKEIG
jgi:Sec-independent protein translocase protein TatA